MTFSEIKLDLFGSPIFLFMGEFSEMSTDKNFINLFDHNEDFKESDIYKSFIDKESDYVKGFVHHTTLKEMYNTNPYFCIFIESCNGKVSCNTIAHEVFHIVYSILPEYASMALNEHTEELYAYTIGYITNCIYKIAKENNFKIVLDEEFDADSIKRRKINFK